MTTRQILRQHAFAKRHPEWEDDLRDANLAIAHAHGMLSDCRLTHKEYKDFEAHLWHEMLDKMPAEVFSEMMADGSLNDLEALARGYDDNRDAGDVLDSRKAVERKIKADALEQKWIDGTIDSKTYAQLSRDHVGKSEQLDTMIADGDHDGAAVEAFGRTYDDKPDHENALERYLNEKYGDTKRPDGRKVEPFSMKRDDRSNWEKATDRDGITDLDMVADLDRGGAATHHPNGYVEHDTVIELGSSMSSSSNHSGSSDG